MKRGPWRDISDFCFTLVACAVLVAATAAATLAKILQYYDFRIHDWDTGIYFNVAWNVLNGRGFHSSILGRNHLGEHFSPVIAIFAPILHFSPTPIALLVAQGVAVGATYAILFFIAVKILTDSEIPYAKPISLLFPVWAYFYKPLTSALLYEFHPSTLATPLLAAAVLALLYRRDVVLWGLIVLFLMTKENAPLGVLGLAIYSGLVLKRWRLSLALLTAAAVATWLIMGIVMPLFQDGHWGHYSRFGPTALLREKGDYIFTLLKSLAFLPLAAWRSLLAALPLIGLNLSVNYQAQISMNFQYDDLASVLLIVAAINGFVAILNLLRSFWPDWAVLLACTGAALAVFPHIREESRSPIPFGTVLKPDERVWQLHRELARYRRLPPDVGITATQPLGPYVSARDRYVPLDWRACQGLETLQPGDYVLITPIRSRHYAAEVERHLDADLRLIRVHTSPVLIVYRFTDLSKNGTDKWIC